MDPAVQAALLGGAAGGVVGGIFTLLGVALGLFGERRARARGNVECLIGDDNWTAQHSAYSDEHKRSIVLERRLKVLFVNGKDLPVTVLDMRVVFYKDGKPLEKELQPAFVQFLDEQGRRSEPRPVTLPPHVHVEQELFLSLNTAAQQWALDESDRAEFVAVLLGVGTEDITRELAPWRQLPPQP